MDRIIYLVVFLLLVAAVCLMLRLDVAIRTLVVFSDEKKQKIMSFQQKGRFRLLAERLIGNYRNLVEASNIPWPVILGFSGVCVVAGFFAGHVVYSSLIVSICVAVFGAFVPMLLLSFRQNKAISSRLERLASSMMLLSNSYLMTEDFITSIQQNLDLLEYPEPFRDFLTYVTRMDSNIRTGLRRMETQVNNPYFSQWIDALIMAQEDRSLKYVTVAVVDSFHDVIQAQQDSDAAMFAVWRDYLLTLVLIFSVPLVFRTMMYDAYLTMSGSFGGQAMFVLLLGAVAYSVVRAVHINRPILS